MPSKLGTVLSALSSDVLPMGMSLSQGKNMKAVASRLMCERTRVHVHRTRYVCRAVSSRAASRLQPTPIPEKFTVDYPPPKLSTCRFFVSYALRRFKTGVVF